MNEPCCALRTSAIDEDDAADLAPAFAALSDPTRLRLYSMIASADGSAVCACEFVAALNRSQGTISHHLKILFEAGLIKREKRGVWVWYSASNARRKELKAALA